jgi:hypothetical protein
MEFNVSRAFAAMPGGNTVYPRLVAVSCPSVSAQFQNSFNAWLRTGSKPEAGA